MSTDTPETDEALSTAECESDLVMSMRRIEREREEWKAKYIQQNKDLGCEQMDPNGTIWDHAKTLQRERDEALGALAEIENKMRVELGGHPDSELWGGSGLIAATMRCVDALGEVTDQRDDALAESIRWMSIAEGRGRTDDEEENDTQAELAAWELLKEATEQRDRLAEALQDMLSGWEYIRLQHGYLHGVGWDRAQNKAEHALQSLTPKP